MAFAPKAAVCAVFLATLGCKSVNGGQSQVKETYFSPVLSSLTPTVSIPNAHEVGDRVYRGMLPVAYDQLKNQLFKHEDANHQVANNLQITDMLILDSRYNDNIVFEMDTMQSKLGVVPAADYGPNDSSPQFASQEQQFRLQPWDSAVHTAPLNYFYRPLMWHNLSPFDNNCKQYIDALRIIKHVMDTPDRRVYFHCTVGEDRTGVVAALYLLLNNPNASIPQIFHDEMCERGYEAGNPSKGMNVVNTIRANLTPFFLKMAYKVKAGQLTWDNLDYNTCEDDPINSEEFSSDMMYNAENYKCQPSSEAIIRPRGN